MFSLIWRKHDFSAKHYALQKQITGNIFWVKYFKSVVLIYIKYIVSETAVISSQLAVSDDDTN